MYASLKKQFRNKSAILFYSGLLFLCITSYALGATPEFVPLTGLPGLRNLDKNTSIATYINAVYLTIIAIGALIGVVRLAMAGVKYSLDDIVTRKQDAKDDIKGVLLGLAILLIPFIVLNTIYPGLTNLDVLSSAPKVNLNTQRTGGLQDARREYEETYHPVENFSNGCATQGKISSFNETSNSVTCLNATVTERRKNCTDVYRGTWSGNGSRICTLPANMTASTTTP